MTTQQDVFARILKDLREKEINNKDEEKKYSEEDIAKLKSACRNFLGKQSFEVGQIVKWKKDLENRKFPHKKQPAIVIAVLEKPIINTENESGSPYFLETLDIILGIIDDEGTFLTFYYDSRRFEAYLES